MKYIIVLQIISLFFLQKFLFKKSQTTKYKSQINNNVQYSKT